jgi:uncharacterized protein
MIYVDTSVWVALCTQEVKTADTLRWYAKCTAALVSATWCVTEFASALSLKTRTQQLTSKQASAAWVYFERLCANDLELLPVESAVFHQAALLTMNHRSGLRAGDALHLACALAIKAKSLATLDVLLAKNARQLKIECIAL